MMTRDQLGREWQRLKEVELQSLDLKEAGEWPPLLRALCVALVFLLAFGGLVWWEVSDKRAKLAEEKRQEARLLSEYRVKASEVALLPNVQNQLMDLEEQMGRMRAMLPTSAEIPSLLDSISDAAVDNRLTIEVIRLRATVSNEHYIEHPLDIQVRGGYHQLASFAADISQLARIVTQHDLTIAPVDGQGDSLRLSLVARTYSYLDDPAGAQVTP
ncbi:type 4a pilus biogenesis protein PilO [Vreelandella malpeensis]|uniref:Type 4a pilus biogenesis protein PilO n=1 Tax=Vreelandella malpeensis TaxID=1172368 RepID=A0ABS8DRK1_9GAMM|nr:type 4a pilus biogenesis protein PilO [Halomonas malpeensis]MCB8888952.1 type 4a pilus biogenesis protein PilO [Halomonas malpeensis]